MKKIILFCFVLQFYGAICKGQTDTAFWFAAPAVSSAFGYDMPIIIRISSYQNSCNVSITQPANGGMASQNINIPPNSTVSVNLTNWLSNIECTPGNVVQNRGIKIASDNMISVYYDVGAGGDNPEIFSLKGRNALGNAFYISSQYLLNNASEYTPLPYSSFNIVASENNTIVNITPTNNIIGHSANVPFSIILNKGQTYAAIATSQNANQHLQGSYVSSNKPIAVTLADDLLDGSPFNGICRDLIGDQTIPINNLGTNYIAIKTNLNNPFDQLFITATQDNTILKQDGVYITNLNAGQSTQLPITNNSTSIQSSLPVYVYQLAGIGCEVGSAILPKLNCTGSSSVSIARSSNENFTAVLLIKNGSQGQFFVNNISGVINANQFEAVPNTGGVWYQAKIDFPLSNYPVGTIVKISNATNVFQMGALQGGVFSGSSFGYFSDFNTFQPRASFGNANFCIGSTVQLLADTIANASFNWTGPNNFLSNLQNPTLANISAANVGKYFLTATIPSCGTYTDSINLTIRPLATILISPPDTAICNNTSIQLFASGGAVYNWTPKSTLNNATIANPVATPTSSVTTYFATVTDTNNCVGTDSVKITVIPSPTFTISPAQSTCTGVPAQLLASGGDMYLWSPSNLVSNASISNPISTVSTTTHYSVLIKDTKCNTNTSLNTTVTVNPLPTITVSKSNDIDCTFGSSKLTATGALQYTWLPTTTITDPFSASTNASPVVNTTYVVTGTDTNGCSNSDSITVAVTNLNTSSYYLPNSFTPNGDGLNDCFGIKYWGNIKKLDFSIYNRYGERVFYTNNTYECWDGTYKGAKSLADNYVYYIKATTLCGTVERKGNVLLIR